ncbi:MAG: hypothetical protein HQL51_11290 [Magnetococcales bacterium]|nr:hypothetical protein [Magnetococcales bacterium]
MAALPEFRLLERLLAEQCRSGDDEAAVILKEGKEITRFSNRRTRPQDGATE